MTRGFDPYFILGSNIFFLAVIHLLDITYLSKLLNRSETLCKRTYNEYRGWGISEVVFRPSLLTASVGAPVGNPCRGHVWVCLTDGTTQLDIPMPYPPNAQPPMP